MKRAALPLVFLAGTLLATPAPAETARQGDVLKIPDTAEVHVVVKGDTLWDIATAYLEDPFMWPKIWRDNEQVLNPDLIYPGGHIRIPVALLKPEIRQKIAPAQKTVEVPVPSGTLSPVLVEKAGYIVDDLDDAGKVVGTYENHFLMGEGDPVFLKLNGEAKAGEEFFVVRPIRVVRYPHSLRTVGRLVHVLGVVKIVSVEGEAVQANVERFYDAITTGDRLTPYVRPNVAFTEGTPQVDGMVVASYDQRNIVGAGDVLYLDRGAKDGLEPGMVVEVSEKDEHIGSEGMFGGVDVPGRTVARLRVLSVRDGNATAWVEHSDTPIRVGDHFRSPETDAPATAKGAKDAEGEPAS
jgi:LysM domain